MTDKYDDIFRKNGLHVSRMISFSKSFYREEYPDNEVYFNANVFTLEDGKIWYGDLDLTLDTEKLKDVSKEIGKKLYVLYEMDGRFENEKQSKSWIKEKAVAII